MAVITITSQLGASEDQFAARLAEKLSYQYVDRKKYEEVLKEYGIVNFKEMLDNPPHFLDKFAREKRDTADLLNKMYLLFAHRNNIVLHSRRAFLILESFVNVLNVFLKAPKFVRIQNLMRWEQIGERSAAEKIQEEENTRKKIIESFYKKKWDSFSPWTLVLNTHKLGFELSKKLILEANSQVATFDDAIGWQDGFPSIDTIEADPILEKAVNKVLVEDKTLSPGMEG
jgi:cytidylate kinase